LPVGTEGNRSNPIRVRRHTFETGSCHHFIRISQHLFGDFHFFHNRLNNSSLTDSTPTPTEGKERKPIETIPVPPEEKKDRGIDDMTPALSLTVFTSLTFSNLRGKVLFSLNQSSNFLISRLCLVIISPVHGTKSLKVFFTGVFTNFLLQRHLFLKKLLQVNLPMHCLSSLRIFCVISKAVLIINTQHWQNFSNINNNKNNSSQTSFLLLVEMATCKVRKQPSSEMMGKTAIGTATERIIQVDRLNSRRDRDGCFPATWTFSTKMTQEVDEDTCQEAIAKNGFGFARLLFTLNFYTLVCTRVKGFSRVTVSNFDFWN
jgi:hypothetical protein